jgi:hypothetical protein
LSPNRTPKNSRNTFSLRLAVGVPALALLAFAGGVVGTWSARTAPAAATQAATSARAISTRAGSGSSADRSIALDALMSAPRSVAPAISSRHPAGGAGRARRRATAKQMAWRMLRHFHWSTHQFTYLNRLWARESGWNIYASNPYSGAYGIPQAVPGSKMASAGSHWRTSARTQIRWGLRYIRERYGSPRAAWGHEAGVGWY